MPLSESFPTTLEAARRGAPWAWTAIYKELAPAVTGYLRANGAADPDDLTGEVFLRVVSDIARFAGDEAHFRSWVFVIAHHRLIDDRRRRIRRPETPIRLDALQPLSPNGNVEREAMDSLSNDAVEAIIRRCAPDQREVLLLRVLGGLTLAETAYVLGKTLGAVKALQRRGIAAIGREFAREGVPL
ncbi:MAG TPA: sigma-70 family RNA polymerase sigma factor [Actinomycetota bacterium]|nr:sigma-70 family RNA polymerase sigma factor [Actinomycetota bacterium]